MATKKIVISDQPEEPEAVDSSPAEEAPAKEPTAPEEPTTESTEAPQADADQPSEDPAPDPDMQPEAPAVAHNRSGFSAMKSVRLPKSRRLVVIAVVVLVVLAGAYLLLKPSYSNPLPKSVTQQATFDVYYPKPNSSDYTYAAGSGNYTAGKLSYSLVPKVNRTQGSGAFVRVSETALQGQGPNLHLLPNFTVFKAPAGDAAVGPDGQVLNAVVVTKKTLIILNGLGGVRRQDLIQIINSM